MKKQMKNFLRSPLTLVWLCAFMDVIGISIINPFLSQYILQYGASVAQAGWVLSANSFIAFFSSIIWGRLSDRFGRKPILFICRMGSLVGYLLLAFSHNLFFLIAARVVDGIFSRGILISLTVVGDQVPAQEHSAEMSKIGLAWILGNLVGPAIGAMLSKFGLARLGFASALLSLGALLITQFTLAESNKAIVASQLKEIGQTPTASLLKTAAPRALLGQSLFMTLSHFVFATTVSLFLVIRFQMDNVRIGWLLAGIGCANLLVRLFVFPFVLRWLRDERALMSGLWIYLVSFIWLMFLDSLWEYALVYMLVSFATTISVDLMNGIMSRMVSERQMGEMIGLNSAVENISLILGPVIGSNLLAAANPYYYGMSAAVFGLTALVIGRSFLGFSATARPAGEVQPG